MSAINAQVVNPVNAYTANELPQTAVMARQSETKPSEFWERLMEAWKAKGLPTTQNGVATKLGMSQGSTRRWYLGDGYPETDVLRKIADLGDVNIDWLLRKALPKSPIGPGTPLGKLMLVWEDLDFRGREHVYQSAVGQLALKAPDPAPAVKKIKSINSTQF